MTEHETSHDPMPREEWLAFARQRAREFLDLDDLRNALSSMLSDLGKHSETRELETNARRAIQAVVDQDKPWLIAWIDGFR
jgi:hypothetical protein